MQNVLLVASSTMMRFNRISRSSARIPRKANPTLAFGSGSEERKKKLYVRDVVFSVL